MNGNLFEMAPQKVKQTLDVLAIFAHPDDAELTCGGTIIKLVDLGYRVGVVDLTRGEMGTRGSAQERLKEAKSAAKVLGLHLRENLRLLDSRVENSFENRLGVVHLLRKYRPHLLLLPYWQQRHPDHYKSSRLIYEACYLSGLKKLKAPGEPFRPYKIIYSTSFIEVQHSFIVDVTEQFERKLEAVRCYQSQFSEKWGPTIFRPAEDVFDFLEVKARHYGYLIGAKYGEAFLTVEMTEVEDPMMLLNKSI